jgi:D-amino-acid dehydrogenase
MTLAQNALSSINKQTQTAVVIGAGIVGVNCALALQMRGYKVTLFDKEGIGAGCSKRNAGHFATEQVFPLAEPSLLWQLPKMLFDPLGPVALSPKHFLKAIPWFLKFFNNMKTKKSLKNTAALQSLNLNAITCYESLLKLANAEHLLIKNGSLLVFEKTSYNKVLTIYEKYKQAGIAVELLNQQQALTLEPHLNENIQYALYFTEVAHTGDPLLVCFTLSAFAESLGMKFQKLGVETIEHASTGVKIKTADETLNFDKCIVATGAYSKKLLNQLGYKLPIEAERGYSLTLPVSTSEKHMLSRPVASAERKFIITPMTNMLRFSGTVEYAGLSAKENNKRADMLKDNAKFIMSSLPKNEAKKNKRWMGCRPSLPDSLPVIGSAPEHSNIFFALGHQHLGLTQGAITGKLIGQLVDGDKTDIDITPFCISRFN